MGHIAADCWKLKSKKEIEEKQNQYKKPAIVDCVVESESDGHVLVATMSLATTSGKRAGDDWVLDYIRTYHMCFHKDWFVTYESIHTEIVLLGNNIECKVAGIGTMQIKTHNGVVRTLSKVRQIPDMIHNLISLDAFEANGCRNSAEYGVLKVMKSAMVLMKGFKQGNLYLLQGTIVTGSTAFCITSTDVDTTRLWHIRLGHMSEKGMTILNKKGCLGRT